MNKYRVITLCGSTRFKDAFGEINKRLTLEGNVVLSVGLFSHTEENGREWLGNEMKEMLVQ